MNNKNNKKIQSILFVCLGNICRSPLAEAIGKKYSDLYNLDLKIDSAGTGNWHIGEKPCDDSIKVAKLNGLDISTYKARQIRPNDFDEFDLIVVMDQKNLLDLQIKKLKGAIKIGDFGLNGADIPDPYFFDGFDGFPKVYEMIEIGIKALYKEYFGVE